MTAHTAQGWHVDPLGRHEARWISSGRLTALVCDGGVEAQDPPPAETFEGELVEIDNPMADGADLLRADDRSEPYSGKAAREAAFDAVASSGPGFS